MTRLGSIYVHVYVAYCKSCNLTFGIDINYIEYAEDNIKANTSNSKMIIRTGSAIETIQFVH